MRRNDGGIKVVLPPRGRGARVAVLAGIALALAPAAHAASPGRNGIIAFTRHAPGAGSGLFAVNADGSGRTSLRQPGQRVTWSPDGNRIAYDVFNGGNNDFSVWVANADGSGATRLVGNFAHSPSWSPDGKRIAYVSQPNGNYYGVVKVMNADGTGQQTISTEGRFDIASEISWGPAGIAAAGNFVCGTDEGTSGLYVLGLDGSCRVVLRDFSISDYLANITSVDWSPDGTRIAYTMWTPPAGPFNGCTPGCQPFDAYVVDPATREVRNLTNFAAAPGTDRAVQVATSVAWAPDGTRLVLAATLPPTGRANEALRKQLFLIPAGGGALTRLTDPFREDPSANPEDVQASWQPCVARVTKRCASAPTNDEPKRQPRCRRHVVAFLEADGATPLSHLVGNGCWTIERTRPAPGADHSHDFGGSANACDRSVDGLYWAWDEIGPLTVAHRGWVRECQALTLRLYGTRTGVLYYGRTPDGGWRTDFIPPPGVSPKYRFLELYARRDIVTGSSLAVWRRSWRPRGYAAMINVGGTGSDKTVQSALATACAATPAGVVGLWQGSGEVQQAEEKGRQAAIVLALDTCTGG